MGNGNSICMQLEQAAKAYGTRADKQLQALGISHAQASALCLLVNTFGGSCLQSRLREELEISGPGLSGLLQRLEKCGFIKRTKEMRDARKLQVYATEKACACMPALTACLQECERQALLGLDANELKQLESILKKIQKNCADEACRKGAQM